MLFYRVCTPAKDYVSLLPVEIATQAITSQQIFLLMDILFLQTQQLLQSHIIAVLY